MIKKKENKKRTKKIILTIKLIKVLFIIVFIFAFSFILTKISVQYNNKQIKELNNVINDTEKIRSETNDIDRRVMLTKKYIDTWNNVITDKQKEKDGIDIEYIKQIITNITGRYPITNLNMSFSIPTDSFYNSRSVVSVMNSEIILSFDCLTEYDVYHFLDDLYKNKDLFFVIESFNIRRTKNITKEFIKSLIDNGFEKNTLFGVNMKIQWYEFSGK